MDRPYRRRVRSPSPYDNPPNLRGVEVDAERGAIGGERRFVYHHHHYHHHHQDRRVSLSPSPPRRQRRGSPVDQFRRLFARRGPSPDSRDPSPRRRQRRWASPIHRRRRSASPAESRRVPLPAQRSPANRSPSPQLPPIIVRRGRNTPPRVPLPVRPASVSSIASSFLFPRPIAPAPPSQPSLVLSAPPTDAPAPVAIPVASQGSSSVEKSIAERPFDEVPEGEGREPLPPVPPTDPRTPSDDPIVASIGEAERLLDELSITVQSFGAPLHSSPVEPEIDVPPPSSPPFDWDSLSGLVPLSDSDSDSFRSESSYIPEQVNRSRSELDLLIRSELFNILDSGTSRENAWSALLEKFLEEACSSADEFRALFTFACNTARDKTFEKGFFRICDEVLRS